VWVARAKLLERLEANVSARTEDQALEQQRKIERESNG